MNERAELKEYYVGYLSSASCRCFTGAVDTAPEIGGYELQFQAARAPLRLRIHDLARTRMRYGYFRIYIMLRREGWLVNHKRFAAGIGRMD